MRKEVSLGQELLRQAFHLLLVFFFIALILFFGKFNALAYAAFVLLAGTVASLLLANDDRVTFLHRVVKRVQRKQERELPGKAALLLVLAVITAIIIFYVHPLEVLVGALLVLGFGDAASTVFGKAFGRTMVWKRRTLEGSLAGIMLSFLALLAIVNPLTAFLTAFFGMMAEYLPLDDNFGVPLTAGLVLILLL